MSEEGVTIEFLSRDKLADKEFDEKLELVLEKVKEGGVLVLEESWSPKQKRQLIEDSMQEASEEFPGIEFMGIESEETKFEKARSIVLDKFFNKESKPGLTIVGNSRVIDKIREEKNEVAFLAKLGDE